MKPLRLVLPHQRLDGERVCPTPCRRSVQMPLERTPAAGGTIVLDRLFSLHVLASALTPCVCICINDGRLASLRDHEEYCAGGRPDPA